MTTTLVATPPMLGLFSKSFSVGKLLMAAMGSPLRLGGGVGVSVVVATERASPSSESKRSAGGCSQLRPPVGLEMVVEVTGVKVVRLGELEVKMDLYRTSAEDAEFVTRVADALPEEVTRPTGVDNFWALSKAVAAMPGMMSATRWAILVRLVELAALVRTICRVPTV